MPRIVKQSEGGLFHEKSSLLFSNWKLSKVKINFKCSEQSSNEVAEVIS